MGNNISASVQESATHSYDGEYQPAEVVDFSRSIPPLPASVQLHLRRTLTKLAQRDDIDFLQRVAVASGSDIDRAAGAEWLRPRFWAQIPIERLCVTSGTQSALFVLFDALVGKDNLLLSESLSYGVISLVAKRAHVRMKGLAIDDDGIIPAAFEESCRRDSPKALYCNPTDQNPTTAVMPETRRIEIAAIARRYGVPIIEDDPLGRLHLHGPRPITALAPDICWYVMGLTKCLAHGMRMAYMVGPSQKELEEVIAPWVKLSYWSPQPLAAAITTSWIQEGAAEEISQDILAESTERQKLAAKLLVGADIVTKPTGLHLWLRLPREMDRNDLVAGLRQDGVLVRAADLFAVDDTPAPNAIRLSLSSPLQRSDVKRGLEMVAARLRHS
jgi:DNA-binding transcriptional MocR family regulator